MYTNTPRGNSGRFESWNGKVTEAGSYTGEDAALAAIAVVVGALLWEGCKWLYRKAAD